MPNSLGENALFSHVGYKILQYISIFYSFVSRLVDYLTEQAGFSFRLTPSIPHYFYIHLV